MAVIASVVSVAGCDPAGPADTPGPVVTVSPSGDSHMLRFEVVNHGKPNIVTYARQVELPCGYATNITIAGVGQTEFNLRPRCEGDDVVYEAVSSFPVVLRIRDDQDLLISEEIVSGEAPKRIKLERGNGSERLK